MRRFLFFIPGVLLGALLCQSVFATNYLINDGGRTYACTLYPGTARGARISKKHPAVLLKKAGGRCGFVESWYHKYNLLKERGD